MVKDIDSELIWQGSVVVLGEVIAKRLVPKCHMLVVSGDHYCLTTNTLMAIKLSKETEKEGSCFQATERFRVKMNEAFFINKHKIISVVDQFDSASMKLILEELKQALIPKF